ncbi:ArgR family transcriptional regulator [Halosquirtibacter laminarini]|uniref:ArgR family transcriptional regulator n=1 Tax=Halosquirtibacter laminarini TaxID=3374600 RepID=A0AC61NN80_9BACT|nr:ArgR family transcriptional regulator [Prolixibacteraceae bacterium]
MKTKKERLIKIVELIKKHHIENHEHLLKLLDEAGYDVAQATLSRDLNSLRVVKMRDNNGGFYYHLPPSQDNDEDPTGNESNTTHVNFLADGFRSLVFSGNMGVIKTIPGYASSIAAIIDGQDIFEILGTIAGDDTILLVVREGITRRAVASKLIELFPRLINTIDITDY